MGSTQAERITALETQVSFLLAEQRDMNKKLDELLALKYKGAGVFWISSVLFGSTLMGLLATFTSFFTRH